ncbi:hypothetical protein E8E14_009656 [Neopestalotiopsis sp. 37M]|nr:hypothetical protein E8E14_009656 [Neopestalotiopsis sp. 37M]
MAFSVRAVLATLCALPLALGSYPASSNGGKCAASRYEAQPRAFICTDMSNEPDDQMSLVRLLTYSNEINITAIAAVTSVWKNDTIDKETIETVLTAYGGVVDNLNANILDDAAAYPTGDYLLDRLVTGWPVYGLAAFDEDGISTAAQKLIEEADASSAESPLWVALWGGANVLAEALRNVSATRDADAIDAFVSGLRIYSISDQDNAGRWIRYNYPELFFVVSLHGFSEYTQATWNGISGELFRHFDKGGPDTSLVTNDWLQTHIRIGELGQHYPNFSYIMEGDTPSFFPLIQNGLGDIEHPEWGSWGGRYIPEDASGGSAVYADASDFVIGANGDTFYSGFASIWRWRQAYQHDFAARMGWTTGGFDENNHAPVAVINGTCGPTALQLNYTFGDSIVLDASESWDPDNDNLSFEWLHYREVVQRLEGEISPVSENVTFTPSETQNGLVSITPNDNITMHIILQVQDDRPMNVTTYRRIILNPIA